MMSSPSIINKPPEAAISALCWCLDSPVKWLMENMLELNLDKTEVMLFGKDDIVKGTMLSTVEGVRHFF